MNASRSPRQAVGSLLESRMVQSGPEAAFEKGKILGGKYRVERTLGAGAMGVVVLARHVELNQPVAIKVLRPELSQHGDVAMRFREEAKATAALRSEHAVRVYDVSSPDISPPFIVMERLKGVDLQALIEQGPLELPVVVDYLLQTCMGVAAAHALGIVHRDLKPANLFLAERDDGGHVVKVLDFGIAKSVLEDSQLFRHTSNGEMKGTPAYMSPEQLESPLDVGPGTDVWALGVILCELATGGMPFEATTIPSLCAKIIKDSPTPPSALRPGLPPELDTVVLKCLQKKPSLRYRSVGELAMALEWLAPEPGSKRASRVGAALLRETGTTEPPVSSPASPRNPERASPTALVRESQRAPARSNQTVAIVAGVATLLVAGLVAFFVSRSSHAEADVTPAPSASPVVAPSVPPPATVVATAFAAPSSVPEVTLDQLPAASAVPSTSPPAATARPAGPRPAAAPAKPASVDDREFGGRK
jgi:serine/threonine-protein kinase